MPPKYSGGRRLRDGRAQFAFDLFLPVRRDDFGDGQIPIKSCSAWLNHLHRYKSNSVTTITASILKDTRTAPRRTLPCAAPRPKCRPNPCHSQKPNGTVSALKTKSCHCNAPCRSNVPPSPPRSNASTSKYRPFAMRQKPAKNWKRQSPGDRRLRAPAKTPRGISEPKAGPPHATNRGYGLRPSVAQEICNGCSPTRETEPPVNHG